MTGPTRDDAISMYFLFNFPMFNQLEEVFSAPLIVRSCDISPIFSPFSSSFTFDFTIFVEQIVRFRCRSGNRVCRDQTHQRLFLKFLFCSSCVWLIQWDENNSPSLFNYQTIEKTSSLQIKSLYTISFFNLVSVSFSRNRKRKCKH